VDAYLAVASKRDQREYAERPVPEDAVRRILDAGRIAGSAKNRQPWRFLVLADRGLVDQVAQTVHAPPNLLGAPLVIAIVVSGKGPVAFDTGRAAQNMMLAAWNEGVVSCPNGIANPESLGELLGLEADEQVQIVLSFGYPALVPA
jgi:nitroreductase